MTAPSDGTVLDRLHATILGRRTADPAESYSAKMLKAGRAAIARKVGEESVETIIAAVAESPDRLTAESADLLYHLVLLWADAGIAPAAIWAELERRRGVSGIAEKDSRKP
jgi:phosphoribosyl-ATP pyrophosphohydrolase